MDNLEFKNDKTSISLFNIEYFEKNTHEIDLNSAI